jgi:hypothetical protein
MLRVPRRFLRLPIRIMLIFLAWNPPIFLCLLLRVVKGQILYIFIKKFRADFFFNSQKVEIPLRSHDKFQKFISSD